MRAAVITVSTSKAAGEGEDESGPALAELARELGAELAGTEVIPDDRGQIEDRLRHWCDIEGCELVLTTGGTGFAPNDVTPEATRAVIEREAPGIGEAMRAASREHTPNWMLSRAVAGTRGASLIVNFPGSPRSIRQTGDVLAPALPHALALLRGERPAHS
ncbi:MAG: molybdopterin adenylyltransferase [Solirubrobacteraceae bacterium]|nr:molybdopterin adenylyltransferase [Solirubrobacteraceae bacterium]